MRNSKTKGFTLIELIVVMAIIGVLAAILVPSMIGYLNDSKYSKANANAKQVYQSAANWCTKCETNNHPVSGLKFTSDNLTTSVANSEILFDASDADLKRALKCYMGGNQNSGEGGAAIENSAPTFAQWRGNSTEKIMGEYPTALSANKTGTWGKQTAAGNTSSTTT